MQADFYFKHINGPLFFGSTSEFQALAGKIPESANAVVFRMSKMTYLDQSGLYAIEDVVIGLRAKNVDVYFIDIDEQPRYMMERVKLIPDLIDEKHIFDSLDSFKSHEALNSKG